jgi:phage terminase large subunit GpA-like protein
MKSARIGYTKMIDAAIGYFIDGDPCPILVVQPSIETAKIYSKEEIAPMLRDVEVLAGLVSEAKARSSDNTISHKTFPGGVLSTVGANSGKGFRMISRRVVIFDEVDAYPPSAGNEGDPIKLGEKRAEYYWNRKIVAGSTPLIAGRRASKRSSRPAIERRYFVPCPHCGHFDFLRFSERAKGADDTEIDRRRPRHAVAGRSPGGRGLRVCQQVWMRHRREAQASDDRGRRMARAAEFKGHASFHIWAAYSLSPNAAGGNIAAEFVAAKKNPDMLRTFVNTVLGETWKEKGEAPDWEVLYERREAYQMGTVPDGVVVLTCGVDVQQDRFVYEIVGWTPDLESFSIERGNLWGDTANDADMASARRAPGPIVRWLRAPIRMMAVDSGYRTQMAYNWGRRHPQSRVIVTKGVPARECSSVAVEGRGHRPRKEAEARLSGLAGRRRHREIRALRLARSSRSRRNRRTAVGLLSLPRRLRPGVL